MEPRSWYILLQVDIAVIEAGLGGSQDATNIFESQQSLLAIITALSLEHQGALGRALKLRQCLHQSESFRHIILGVTGIYSIRLSC